MTYKKKDFLIKLILNQFFYKSLVIISFFTAMILLLFITRDENFAAIWPARIIC